MTGWRARVQAGAVLLFYSALACIIAGLMTTIDTGGWAGVDAERFHQMARMIINGFTPYVSFVDPKPPLLYFVVSAMDLVEPPGTLDLPVIAGINAICAFLIWHIGRTDYGQVSGFSAGCLYLVVAAFIQGYFLFSEQFAVLFLLLAFISARESHYAAAGICLGLACGFKQYAILGLIPLLYLMRAQGKNRYHRLVVPAAAVIISTFLVLFLVYGNESMMSALYWTFGVAPAYIGSRPIADIPNYYAGNQFSYAMCLISSIFIVLPVVLFSAASIMQRGLRSPPERTLFIFAVLLSATILVRQYLHYWILVLPFLLLLACREFADTKE